MPRYIKKYDLDAQGQRANRERAAVNEAIEVFNNWVTQGKLVLAKVDEARSQVGEGYQDLDDICDYVRMGIGRD